MISVGVLSYSCSDEAEQVWLWEYETDEGAHDLYMDQGEEIRFRVTDEVFVDTSPTGPATAETDPPAQPGQSTAPPTEEKKEAPYTLIVRTKFMSNIYISRTSASMFLKNKCVISLFYISVCDKEKTGLSHAEPLLCLSEIQKKKVILALHFTLHSFFC